MTSDRDYRTPARIKQRHQPAWKREKALQHGTPVAWFEKYVKASGEATPNA